jgi:hypothetical protein
MREVNERNQSKSGMAPDAGCRRQVSVRPSSVQGAGAALASVPCSSSPADQSPRPFIYAENASALSRMGYPMQRFRVSCPTGGRELLFWRILVGRQGARGAARAKAGRFIVLTQAADSSLGASPTSFTALTMLSARTPAPPSLPAKAVSLFVSSRIGGEGFDTIVPGAVSACFSSLAKMILMATSIGAATTNSSATAVEGPVEGDHRGLAGHGCEQQARATRSAPTAFMPFAISMAHVSGQPLGDRRSTGCQAGAKHRDDWMATSCSISVCSAGDAHQAAELAARVEEADAGEPGARRAGRRRSG